MPDQKPIIYIVDDDPSVRPKNRISSTPLTGLSFGKGRENQEKMKQMNFNSASKP
jgi:hypothetical protein